MKTLTEANTTMRLKDAAKLLGLFNGSIINPDAIRAAFVTAVHTTHPDAGGRGGDLDAITQARDILLQNIGAETPCPQCAGRGSIKARLGSVPCGRCEGEGTIA